MTPDLALTLSFEGIGLLTRVPGGWHLLGEVTLDSADLAGDLAALRSQAIEVAGEEFQTTLVLPNDQIKYLTLPAGRMSQKKRTRAAEDALEASTPYGADQLVYDMTTAGTVPQIAAVARDTLGEAEAFAVEHAFNPVNFSAIPPQDTFAVAPDFGVTQQAQAAATKVEHDPVAILVVGTGPLSPPAKAADEAAETAQTPQPASGPSEDAAVEPGLSSVDAAVDAANLKESDVASEPPDQKGAAEDKVEETPSEPTEAVASPETAQEEQSPPKSDPLAEQNPDQVTPEASATFASIRAQKPTSDESSPATLSGVTRNKVSGTNAPSIPTDTKDGKTPQLRFDPTTAVAGLSEKKTVVSENTDGSEAARDTDVPATFASARGKTKVAGPAPSLGKGSKSKRDAQTAKSKAGQQKLAALGTEKPEVGGKPKHLGLIMTALLLVFLAVVAIWASLTQEDGLAGLFRSDAPEVAVQEIPAENVAQPTATPPETADAQADPSLAEDEQTATASVSPPPLETEAVAPEPPMVVAVPDAITPNPTETVETAILEPSISEDITDSAEIEAAMDEQSDGNVDPVVAESRYAVTGIWQRAPSAPRELPTDSSDDIYIASVDRDTIGFDAIALPAPDALDTDLPARAQVNPVAAATTFDLDARGLVVATPEGALNPEGVMVFAGRPAVLPAAYPKRIKVGEEPQITEADTTRLAILRPKLRPDNLAEKNERATLGGRTLSELAQIRPKLRPESAKLADEKDLTPTQYAVKTSVRPRLKPANISQLAARATPSETAKVAAVPAAAAIVPDIPTTASVARQATIKNAINLNKVNLIGVYGTSSNRRALVRLSSGRYKKVQVGDRIDGGRVSAIGESELRYKKGSRDVVLKMPKG